MLTFNRITQNPEIMAGKPTLRGLRVTASMIIRQLAEGESEESLLVCYPYLEAEDIQQALAHATYFCKSQTNILKYYSSLVAIAESCANAITKP
jgi:uncharacterized protein (DUF433 family)